MRGLDTNVLVRAATSEDPIQGRRARAALARLSAASPGYVNNVVLVEFAWTLRSAYRYERSEILAAIESLLTSEAIVVDRHQAVALALERCRTRRIDFADALIAELNREAGCGTTISFDERAIAHSVFAPVP